MTKPNAAFTALEILIVIAIVGILAAIAIPNFQHAVALQKEREQAKVDQYSGYAAQASQLPDGEVYEVTAAWRDPGSLAQPDISMAKRPGTAYLTLLRTKDNRIRLFELTQNLQPGFYRSKNGLLSPLQAVTLEKN